MCRVWAGVCSAAVHVQCVEFGLESVLHVQFVEFGLESVVLQCMCQAILLRCFI